jgi:alpha-L-fucosidase 2
MLLQSHLRDKNGDYFQDILPALPSALSSGKISGIKGRGAFEIAIEWENGVLKTAKIKSLQGNKLNLRYKGKVISLESIKSKTYTFTLANFNEAG